MKKIIIIVLVTVVAGSAVCFALFHKTDEDKIVDRMETFEKAYADGDLEGLLDCMDTKTRNAYKGIGTIGSMIGGEAGIFNYNFGGDTISALFSLGVASQNAKIKFKVKIIEYEDDAHANVTVDCLESGNTVFSETNETVVLKMTKEKNDWFISEDFNLW